MRHERIPLADRCRGRWRDILSQLGALDAKLLDGKHHPCPWCGGKDRWRFTDHNGTGAFICNQCGHGDGAEIVIRSLGVDFKDAARRIEAVLGGARIETKAARSDDDRRRALNVLWSRARPIAPGDQADIYLLSRLGQRAERGAWPASLRSIDRCDYWSDGAVSSWPGMLCKVTGADGKPCQIQRAFLTEGGTKAPVPEPRKLMPGTLPKGSAVRLGPIADDGKLGVAEGVESAMAASIIHDVPVWACLTAGNLVDFEPPDRANKIIIFGDNDASFTGQEAAYRLAKRLVAKGLGAAVKIPDGVKDWADVLAGEAHAPR